MRFLTYERTSSHPEPGLLLGDTVVSLIGAGFTDLVQVAAGGDEAASKAQTYAASAPADAKAPLGSVRILAPIARPEKILCVGLNYRDHALESNMEIPKVPTIFSKFANTILAPGGNIILPKKSATPDYEAEFAVVIGKPGKNIAAADWAEHVFGYMNLNDVSARDLQLATTQWLMGKSCDTFAPMGPYIVTKDEVPDPHNLDIKITVSGEVLQDSNTRHLIFRIPELIEYISSVMTLQPGDIISTGTPAGVGFARKPPRLLKDGDVCIVEVQGLGQLINPVVSE
jgi:2-keto-4-pentenoate hydratase/2-oxohepta-3-ene-1,7-dioic acid hydratase in catechol pathway